MQVIDFTWDFLCSADLHRRRQVDWRGTFVGWCEMSDLGDERPVIVALAANENHAIAIPHDATSSGKGVGLQ
ncbi:MAG TPA: hypothetical protein VN229_21000 [Terriglobales bacterium]|nr:hypothetical protein [Terriglobales bacterium]